MFSFDINDKVEVKGLPDGKWDESWWEATIIGYNSDHNEYVVEYDTLEESGPDGEANGIRIKEEKAEDQLRPLPSNDSSSKRIPERVHGEPVDIYFDDAWWEGWVQITRDEEIVICFDTGAKECVVPVKQEPKGEDKQRGNFAVRTRKLWDCAAKQWRRVNRRHRRLFRNERTVAAQIPNAFTNALPTSRQLDLAARMSEPGEAHEQQEAAGTPEPQSGQAFDPEQEAPAAAHPGSVPNFGRAHDPEQEASAAAHPASVPNSGQASASEGDASATAHPGSVPIAVQASDPGQEASAAAHPAAVQSEASRLHNLAPQPQAPSASLTARVSAPSQQPQKAAKQKDSRSELPPSEAHAPSAAAQPAKRPAAGSSVPAAPSVTQKSAKQSAEAAKAPNAKDVQEQNPANPEMIKHSVRKAAGRPLGQKPKQDKTVPEVDRVEQVIREKGLQKLPGRRLQDDVDEEEGDLIWTIHEHVPEELKGLVYKKLLPHRTLGEIRDWRSANLRIRKATEKPRQKPQQQEQQEKLSTSGSGTLARRPAMKRKPSALNPCQLVPSDDLFQDSVWGGSTKPQKPRASSAAEAKGPAAVPLKPTAAKPAAQQQQSILSRQEAAPQQPQQQAQRLASDSLRGSAVKEPSSSAAALPEHSMQPVSKRARLDHSESGSRPAADTAPPHSVSLKPQPFGTPLLLQRDLRAEIPDWSLPAQRPSFKAEEPGSTTEPALPYNTAQPPNHQQEATQQQRAFSEVEVIGHSADRKGQPEASTCFVSEGLQKAESRQQQDKGLGGDVSAAAEPEYISEMDTELTSDPLFHQYEAIQEDSAADTMPASMLPRAPSAKPEEAPQLYSMPGWIHQAAGRPMPALVPPRDPRKAAGLGAAQSLPGVKLPFPPRPVKHPRDDSATEKHEGRPAIKRPKTEALKPYRSIVVPTLPAPADSAPKAFGRRLPPMDLKNVNRSKILCLDNLSCIWTSHNDLRHALKAVSSRIEGVRLAKEELDTGGLACYGGWAAMDFSYRQDAEQTLLRLQHLYVRTAASPIPRPLIVHFPHKTKEGLIMEQELGHIKDLYLGSHFAQPNSIEFQPAVAWRHQQKVSADAKALLRQEHAEQLKGIMLEYLKEVGKDAECPFPDTFAAPPVETAWLFLKGLGREALEKPEILRNVFTQWGAGDSTRILADPATQTRRGTAIVQMQGVDQEVSPSEKAVMQAHHLKQDFSKMVYIMHGTPRPLECDSVRLGGPKDCTQAVYDAALLDVFRRSDGKGDRLQRPELMCFEEAHTHEEVYAQRLRALLYQQGGERRMLQEMMLQERRRLHREHETLFDTEVQKLVELQHISMVPAVVRVRTKPPRLVKDLPLRYKRLLSQGSRLLKCIAVSTEAPTPGAAGTGAKPRQDKTNDNDLLSGNDEAGPSKLIGKSLHPILDKSKKARNDSRLISLGKPQNVILHYPHRRVHSQHPKQSVKEGTAKQKHGIVDHGPSKRKDKGSGKHASSNRKVHGSPVSKSQGGPGPMRMGPASPRRHNGRKAKARGRG